MKFIIDSKKNFYFSRKRFSFRHAAHLPYAPSTPPPTSREINPGVDSPSDRREQQELLPRAASSKDAFASRSSDDAPVVVLLSTSTSSSNSFSGPAGRGLHNLRLPRALRLPVRRAPGRGDPEDR